MPAFEDGTEIRFWVGSPAYFVRVRTGQRSAYTAMPFSRSVSTFTIRSP
jgi:hypothetical protein